MFIGYGHGSPTVKNSMLLCAVLIINDILWRAIKRAQMQAVKEPISLMRDDNKCPDGTTLLPRARGKPMAWDVTVPDTYAESHIDNTATKPGAVAEKTAQNKID